MCAPFLHFLLIAVAIRVHDRMAAEAIADGFNETRLMFFTSEPGGIAYGIAHCQNIVTINTLTMHMVGTCLAIYFAHGRHVLNAQTHMIVVVYDEIVDGEAIDVVQLA